MDEYLKALDALDPLDYPEAAREIVKRLTGSELLDHRLYCSDEEPKRRQREQDKTGTIEAVWEAHPELKPEFETGPVEVTPAAENKRVTVEDLLAVYPPYKQPSGAHDAYPTAAQVSDEGRIWRNDLAQLNVWKPGTMNAGWTDITDMLLAELNAGLEHGIEDDGQEPDGAETEEPAVQEWAPDIDVTPGEHYRFQGDTYEVIQAHTTAAHWPPNAVPALYRKV